MGKTAQTQFDYELVITESFPGYAKGDIVTDGAKISELIDGEWSGHFVKKAKQAPADPSAS